MNAYEEASALASALEQLEHLLGSGPDTWARHSPSISAWTVGAQVEHSLKSLRRMLSAIAAIRAADPRAVRAGGKPGMRGRLILRAGRIPRGRAEAPAEVVPEQAPDQATQQVRLERVRVLLAELAPNLGEVHGWVGVVPHPLLGDFRARDWLRFARIHTQHHLAIIDDILAATGSAADAG